jgi:YD repeat-containing protein
MVRYRLGSVVRDVTYDEADRIKGYTHYDAATGAAQPAWLQGFIHDELGRLKHTTLASGYWDYSYDATGNRTGATASGSTSLYTISTTSNRIVSITNPSRNFDYDGAGNTKADGNFSASYDLTGRMATLTKGGVTTTYTYDSLGRRIRKFDTTGPASTVVFFYDQEGHLLGEYDQTGKAIREFVWFGDTPIAVFTPDPAGALLPPIVYFIHTDHIDTPRVVVDKNNAIRWRWMSEPFGVNPPETNPSNLGVFTLNLRFPGQYFDQESQTGEVYYTWTHYGDTAKPAFVRVR